MLGVLLLALGEVPAHWFVTYCGRSAPSIAPVAPADRAGFELASVGVVIRHGARSPGRLSPCWQGYDSDSIHWQCDKPAEKHLLGGLRFALNFAGTPSTLGARSGCAAGQLLDEGRAQHRALGRALRAAYVGPSATVDGLLPDELPLFGETGLSLRSSSLERAIISGQELVAGLVNGSLPDGWGTRSLPWAIGEPDNEWIYPNPKPCPRLNELEAAAAEAYAEDPKTAAFEARTRASLEQAIGNGDLALLRTNVALDCLMCSACQSAVDPGLFPANLTADLAQDAWRAIESFEAHLVSHDRAAWSRLALAPLGNELLEHSRSAVEGRLGRPKFALWSGHDTTVMPLLAALGVHDGKWAPYAANFVVEVWRRSDEPTAAKAALSTVAGDALAPGAASTAAAAAEGARVRLLYMGRDITSRLPGCKPEGGLCGYSHLEAALAPWSMSVGDWLEECAPTAPAAPSTAALARLRGEERGSGRAEAWRMALVAIASAAVGAVSTVAIGAARAKLGAPAAARAGGAVGGKEGARSGGESESELERRLLVTI